MTFLDIAPTLDWPAQFCALTMVVTWVASLVTGNVSQVDRLWTFLPTIYAGYFALLPLFPNDQPFFLFPYTPRAFGWDTATTYSPRAVLMFALIFIWMCRLSYNTYRRGLFNLHDEDYRWAVLRAQMHPVVFQIFNLSFIVIIQNIILLLLGIPVLTAVVQPHDALEASDYALASLALVLLGLEFVADNQQYAYHGYKHAFLSAKSSKPQEYKPEDHWVGSRLNWTPDDAKRGFITRGLWAYSRHPNFFCEQGCWWVITLFPLLSSSEPYLPSSHDLPPLMTILVVLPDPDLRPALFEILVSVLFPAFMHLLPAISLSVLFYASSTFSESISAKKYPSGYAAYQKRVARFAPVGTVAKVLFLKLFKSAEENRRVERLVWGKPGEDDKSK